MNLGKVRSKSGKAAGGTEQDDSKESKVPVAIDRELHNELKQLSGETGRSIGNLVGILLDWGLEVKSDALRKEAQQVFCQRRKRP